jgi:hypothetical protein
VPKPYNPHKLFTYEHADNGYIRAACYCGWNSEWCEFKKEAKDAQVEHDLSERLKGWTSK